MGFADTAQTEAEVEFLFNVLDFQSNAKVLDLCCGYARHATLMSERSTLHVTGMDLSADYLQIAKQGHAGSNLHFVRGDMRRVPFHDSFDVVINLFTSFGFFETDEENETVLKQIHRALKPGGQFLLDYENKFHFVQNDVLQKERCWWRDDSGSLYLIENSYDANTERERLRVLKFENETITESGYNIRLYSLPELKRMLERTGFQLVQVWGDFNAEPYSVQSRRLITLSRKVL